MNETCRELLETYYETNKIPVCIVEQDGEILLSVPKQETEILPEQFRRLCVQDFQLQKRDREHPLVLALEPSYFVGVAQMDPSAYLIFGPVSPVRHTPEEIRKSSIPFVSVEQLSAFGTAVTSDSFDGEPGICQRFLRGLLSGRRRLCAGGIRLSVQQYRSFRFVRKRAAERNLL